MNFMLYRRRPLHAVVHRWRSWDTVVGDVLLPLADDAEGGPQRGPEAEEAPGDAGECPAEQLLQEHLLERGLVWLNPRQDRRPALHRAMLRGRQARDGIWAGNSTPTAPWVWRRLQEQQRKGGALGRRQGHAGPGGRRGSGRGG